MEKFALLVILILVTIIILTSDSQYFPPYDISWIPKTEYKKICERESPTKIYLNIDGDAEAELIFIAFGREQDIVRLILSSAPIAKESGSATYLFLFKTENGWKDAMLLTQKERSDFKKQTAISQEEHAFIQRCFLPKTLI